MDKLIKEMIAKAFSIMLIGKTILNLASFYLIEKPLFIIWRMINRKNDFHLSCYFPFYYLGVNGEGSCYLCCAGWLPYQVGNLKYKSLKRIFNSVRAQRMRIAFYKGNLVFCNLSFCDVINSKNYRPFDKSFILNSELFTERTKKEIISRSLTITDGPSRITDGISNRCNIQCKFCNGGYEKEKKCDNDLCNKLKEFIVKNVNQLRLLNFCAEGEPFIQKYVKDIIKSARNCKEIGFYFTSNLNYIDDETRALLKEINVVQLHASINAANKETYDRIVNNGNWENVMKNLDFFLDLKEKNNKNMYIQISMVVTNQNYKDMVDFVKLGLKKNLNKIAICPMIEYKKNKYLQIVKKEVPVIKEIISGKLFDDSRVEIEAFRNFIDNL